MTHSTQDLNMQAANLLQKGRPAQALALLQTAVSQAPGDADTWHLLGMSYMATNKPGPAENCLRKSLDIEPDRAFTHDRLGDLLALRGDYGNAIHHYTRSLELKPGQVRIHINIGGCFQKERKVAEAIEHYLLAIDHDPHQVLAHTNLGLLFEQQHKTDEATRYANLALKYNPDTVEAHTLLAKLDAREGRLDTALERLDNLLRKNMNAQQRSSTLMAMGTMLDRNREFERSFACMAEAKKIFRSLHGVTEDTLSATRETASFKNTFTRDRTLTWHHEKYSNLPANPAFLVGFPRSGTTLTEQILESHRDVCATHELPVLADMVTNISHILDREFSYPADMESLNREEVETLRSTYWSNIMHGIDAPGSQGACLLDKFPLNIVHIGLIARIFPEARILVALRDPRDACLSCYMQHFEMNAAMAHFLSLEDTAEYYASVMDLWLHYRKNISLNAMEFRYEDIIDDLEGKAAELLDFIGLDWDPQVLKFNESARQRLVHTPSYQGVVKPIYRSSIGRWKNYHRQLETITPHLEPYLQAFGYPE